MALSVPLARSGLSAVWCHCSAFFSSFFSIAFLSRFRPFFGRFWRPFRRRKRLKKRCSFLIDFWKGFASILYRFLLISSRTIFAKVALSSARERDFCNFAPLFFGALFRRFTFQNWSKNRSKIDQNSIKNDWNFDGNLCQSWSCFLTRFFNVFALKMGSKNRSKIDQNSVLV